MAAEVEGGRAPAPAQVVELQRPLAAVAGEAVDEEDGQGVGLLFAAAVANVEITRRTGDPERFRHGWGGFGVRGFRLGTATGRRFGVRVLREHRPPAGQDGRQSAEREQAEKSPEQPFRAAARVSDSWVPPGAQAFFLPVER